MWTSQWFVTMERFAEVVLLHHVGRLKVSPCITWEDLERFLFNTWEDLERSPCITREDLRRSSCIMWEDLERLLCITWEDLERSLYITKYKQIKKMKRQVLKYFILSTVVLTKWSDIFNMLVVGCFVWSTSLQIVSHLQI